LNKRGKTVQTRGRKRRGCGVGDSSPSVKSKGRLNGTISSGRRPKKKEQREKKARGERGDSYDPPSVKIQKGSQRSTPKVAKKKELGEEGQNQKGREKFCESLKGSTAPRTFETGTKKPNGEKTV